MQIRVRPVITEKGVRYVGEKRANNEEWWDPVIIEAWVEFSDGIKAEQRQLASSSVKKVADKMRELYGTAAEFINYEFKG